MACPGPVYRLVSEPGKVAKSLARAVKDVCRQLGWELVITSYEESERGRPLGEH